MITVSFASDVLGSGVFWRGSENDLHEIRNIPARQLAEATAKDGKPRSVGMWKVEQTND